MKKKKARYGGKGQLSEKSRTVGSGNTRKRRVMARDRFQISISCPNKNHHHHHLDCQYGVVKRPPHKHSLLSLLHPLSPPSSLRTWIHLQRLCFVSDISGDEVVIFLCFIIQLIDWWFGWFWWFGLNLMDAAFFTWTSAELSLFQLNFYGLRLDWMIPSLISQRSKKWFEFELFVRFVEAEVGSIELVFLVWIWQMLHFLLELLPNWACFNWILLIPTWLNEP